MTSLKEVAKSPNVIDGALASADLVLKTDYCVIGSGPGGAVTAAVLSAAKKDVLIVEEGGYHSNAEFTMNEADVYPKLYQEGMRRSTEDLGVLILQGRAVGGTSVVNWTTSYRTPEDVVAHWRSKHAVGGFAYADLVPHWERIEQRLCIAAVQPEMINKNNAKLLDGCKALGWETNLLKRNVYACMQSGYCGLGCPYNAKRSMLVTLIPDAIDDGARLLHRARVDRLVKQGGAIVAAEGRLLSANGKEPSGKRFRIEAKRFVVSGGAINSPALLLRSDLNDNGRVGLRTFLHPVVGAAAEYDEPIEPYYGAPQSVASHQFAHRGDKVGVFLEAAPIQPLLGSSTFAGFGAQHLDGYQRLKYTAAHLALAIDGFHDSAPGGRVKLRASGAPVLDYPIPEAVWEAFRFAQERLAEAQLASGAKRSVTLHEPPYEIRGKADLAGIANLPWRTGSVGLFSAHQMGGCAMGDDPKTAVVRSSDLRHHSIDNLYVIDGSVFPTSLGVNPQESIYGLASLMASRLVAA